MRLTYRQVVDVLGFDVAREAIALCRAFGKYWQSISFEEQKEYLGKVMRERGFTADDIEAAMRDTMSYGH